MADTMAVQADQIRPGTVVEVRTRFLRSWACGFEVVSVDGDQARLRRRSDGTILPVTIPFEHVRSVPAYPPFVPVAAGVR
jgi:hypothetical protein